MDGIVGVMMFFLDQKRLQEGIKELNLSASDKQLQMLDKYSELLFKWNKTYNLTAITDKDDVLTHHILDSLSVVNVFKNYLVPNGSMLDVGSGGGLPAIPIAIMLPNCKVSMVETVGKKAAFLRQVTLNLKLTNVQVFHERVENLNHPPFDVISSRAFSSLKNFIDLSKHLLKEDGYWLALKGQKPDAELKEIKNVVSIVVQEVKVPFLNENRNIVIVRNE